MADPRYYQLWAARPSSSSNTAPSSRPYRVDLDAPGGITYAPSSETTSNSAKRRLFIPRRGATDEEYDYGYDVAQNMKSERQQRAKEQQEEDAQVRAALSSSDAVRVTPTNNSPFTIGDEEGDTDGGDAQPSEAQLYAQSVNARPEKTTDDDTDPQSQSQPQVSENTPNTDKSDARSILAASLARSHLSTVTAADLARRQGVFQSPAMLRKDAAVLATFRPPPSISGDSYQSKTPWNAREYQNRREFDKLTEEERERGYSKFEEYSGEGNVPTAEEVRQNAERDAVHGDDAATIKTALTMRTIGGKGQDALRVSDLFIPDPRPYRPLRLVRRSDPQQALILCAGVLLSPTQAQSLKATELAMASGRTIDDILREDSAKAILERFGGDESDEVRGGLGVYFCPPDPTEGESGYPTSPNATPSPRQEPNFSRRMERVTFPHTTTPHRATLRSIIAGLEYIPWAAEGIDKLVIGTNADWLIRGIVYDIHEWRSNDWRLTRQTVLGYPGDDVPDRDLWELLDDAVQQWERTDCSVRFWLVDKRDMEEPKKLARLGAIKDDQQPQMVKWTKKTRQALTG